MKKITVRYKPSASKIEILRPGFLEGQMKVWAINLHANQNLERAMRLGKRIPQVGNDYITKRQQLKAYITNMERPF